MEAPRTAERHLASALPPEFDHQPPVFSPRTLPRGSTAADRMGKGCPWRGFRGLLAPSPKETSASWGGRLFGGSGGSQAVSG
eukprot:CAMPEP_0174936760 /NCGR_PEP_ID=MMETSP1355-20121228/58532_1 /TAXON_ID=464990 /ORGANISM="Hemiselmis tepida, Strain CCMP443" /LENGTH=81 /DNA_ID=CAMNT_0016183571 /DNA_START=130 /DNA_END=372 /DNA_ORIENTATION=+